MDSIYSKARSVCICIPNPWLPAYQTDYGPLFRWLREDIPDTQEDTKQALFMEMQQLFSTRYFSRVWVIQEVALARVVHLTVCDEELELTLTVMDRLRLLCAESRDYKLPGVLGRLFVQELRADVLACLYTGWKCHATDRRDCVFAVLSLMPPEIRSLIPVDYSLDLGAVFANAIVAIIVTQQNLDILSHVKCLSVHWLTYPAFDIDDYGGYLERAVNGREWLLCHVFEGQRIGPWHANIDVKVLPPSNTLHLDQCQGTSCVIVRPTLAGPGDLRPHLFVRAHYIDCVTQRGFKIHMEGASHGPPRNPLFFKRHEYEQIAQFFRADVAMDDQLLQNDHTWYDPSVLMQDDKDIVVADLSKFFEIYREWGRARPLYLSKYSVLFALYDYEGSGLFFQPGDEIFAIDGARVPFVLRKTITGQYKMMSACYMWAALDLDCWNPGTKKGRWGPDLERPAGEQTRMIEIC
ncbi:unnamed protein product [Alternaria alternata]|jgi:hypothetical protein